MRVKGYDDDQPHDSCPVLIKPGHDVCDRALRRRMHLRPASRQGSSLLRMPASFYQRLKYNFATPFALVEMLGPWLGLRMLARTFAPSLISDWQNRPRDIMPPFQPSRDGRHRTAQQADYGESALRMMGLTETWPRWSSSVGMAAPRQTTPMRRLWIAGRAVETTAAGTPDSCDDHERPPVRAILADRGCHPARYAVCGRRARYDDRPCRTVSVRVPIEHQPDRLKSLSALRAGSSNARDTHGGIWPAMCTARRGRERAAEQ